MEVGFQRTPKRDRDFSRFPTIKGVFGKLQDLSTPVSSQNPRNAINFKERKTPPAAHDETIVTTNMVLDSKAVSNGLPDVLVDPPINLPKVVQHHVNLGTCIIKLSII